MENKKGFVIGSKWILGFFFTIMLYVLLIGFTDIFKVEVFDPASDIIRNMTINETGGPSNVYVLGQNEIHNKIDNVTYPYNLFLILMTGYFIFMSILDVASQEKQEFSTLLYRTIGGVIFLVYVSHLFLIGILNWFNVEIIDYFFADLILNYVPFYLTLIDYFWFLFIWALVLSGINKVFGKEKVEGDLF